MPEHTSFLTYLLARLPGLRENAHALGGPILPPGGHPVDYRGLEPIFGSLLVIIFVIYLAAGVRGLGLAQIRRPIPPTEPCARNNAFRIASRYMSPKSSMERCDRPSRTAPLHPVAGGRRQTILKSAGFCRIL